MLFRGSTDTEATTTVILETSRLVIEGVREELGKDKENNVFGVTRMGSETAQKKSVHERLGPVFIHPSGHRELGTMCRVNPVIENRYGFEINFYFC